jgi:hypothetical protein
VSAKESGGVGNASVSSENASVLVDMRSASIKKFSISQGSARALLSVILCCGEENRVAKGSSNGGVARAAGVETEVEYIEVDSEGSW